MAIITCDIRRGRTDDQKRRLAAGLTEVPPFGHRNDLSQCNTQ